MPSNTELENQLAELKADLESLRRECRNVMPGNRDDDYAMRLEDEYHSLTSLIADVERDLS